MKMKMKYTEQAVETLDDAGSVIANKNIEIEQLRQRAAELEQQLIEVRRAERERCAKVCEHMYGDVGEHLAQMIRAWSE